MNVSDTIAAVSSAAGAAARIVVRLAGPSAVGIAGVLSRHPPENLRPGSAARVRLHFSNLSVPSWLYVFRGPRSYTGDDLVEFHLPGNPVLARLLLDHLHDAGTRPAGPGEFTARAFFNGRLDLAEAEGVAATVAAGNERELAAARQLMGGELARRLRPVMDRLAETVALVEAGIDFSDEDVTFLSSDQVRSRAREADAVLESLLADSTRFERVAHEPTAVLVGRPNAGKSTLLNALAGLARAVTSPVAGTTRDAVSAEIVLRRGVIRLVDVAGLDAATGSDAPEVVPDAPEGVVTQMRDRALREIESADFVVLVHDLTDPEPRLSIPREPDLVVRSKGDLAQGGAAVAPGELTVSAATGANLDLLRDWLDGLTFGGPATSAAPALALNARHVGAVDEARQALARAARVAADVPPEVVALELREALDALGQVLGAVTPDDLLGRVFATFCIGK